MAPDQNSAPAIGAIIDPAVADTIVVLPLDVIDATHRLRKINEAYAQVIAANYAERGQRTPVEVVRVADRYRLVSGGHRYRAAEIARLNGLRCIITEADEAEQRLREIDENLIRYELTSLDRALFLAERKRIYEALHPETKHGTNQHTRGVANLATPSFSADIAEKTGFSERTVRRAVDLATSLSDEAIERLRDTPLASNQAALEALAKQPAERQIAALDLMTAEENPAKSVGDAFARLDGKVVRPAEEKHLSKAIDLWGRMGAKDRRAFLSFLYDADLPSGWGLACELRGDAVTRGPSWPVGEEA
ncbi:ParB/RepB/Spo0J family partition protein [Brevundimonas faecalis]|uniref:ParB/RepB/Spo0J family partition protein n=1 Tax=Brevundimonas faecalis TaxID=947378 RepID=UPI00361087E2